MDSFGRQDGRLYVVLPDEGEMEDHGAPADAEGGVEIIPLDSIWNSIRSLSPASLIITPNPLTSFVPNLRLISLYPYKE